DDGKSEAARRRHRAHPVEAVGNASRYGGRRVVFGIAACGLHHRPNACGRWWAGAVGAGTWTGWFGSPKSFRRATASGVQPKLPGSSHRIRAAGELGASAKKSRGPTPNAQHCPADAEHWARGAVENIVACAARCGSRTNPAVTAHLIEPGRSAFSSST